MLVVKQAEVLGLMELSSLKSFFYSPAGGVALGARPGAPGGGGLRLPEFLWGQHPSRDPSPLRETTLIVLLILYHVFKFLIYTLGTARS